MKSSLKKAKILLILSLSICSNLCLGTDEPWNTAMMFDLLELINKATSTNEPLSSFFIKGQNKRNEFFRAETEEKINAELKILDSLGNRTLMYVGYCWLEYKLPEGEVAGPEVQKKFRQVQKAKVDKIYRFLQSQNHKIENLNLHINLMTYVKIRKPNTNPDNDSEHDQELFVDYLYPRADMSSTCKKEIIKELNQSIQAKGEGAISADLNRAMIWRAKLLKEKLSLCPTIPALTGDQAKDLMEVLNYIKEKAKAKQQVLLRPSMASKLEAKNFKLANTTYASMNFEHSAKEDPSFADPMDYIAKEDEKQKTITWTFQDKEKKELFRIQLNDSKYKQKKDSLEKWLWGEIQGNRIFTEADYERAAKDLGVKVAAVKAFSEVESNGNGYLKDGRLKILFEGHKFYYHLKKTFQLKPGDWMNNETKDIIYKNWTTEHYKGGAGEYERLGRAKAIHEDAALMSTSYGYFQIMGENYAVCGYSNVKDFVKAMQNSAAKQMDALVLFLRSRGIQKDIIDENWSEVARKYNGPEYKENEYDSKLENAYEKYD